MIRFPIFVVLASLAVSSSAPAEGLDAQPELSNRDVHQIVEQAVRTALTDARVGSRAVTADSAVVLDAASLLISSSNGARQYSVASTDILDVGRKLTLGSREAVFDCPARVVAPALSADCSPRGNRTYVRVGLLDVIDANAVTLWVSIIAPGDRSLKAARAERFLDHTVQIVVKKGPDGWTIGIPTTRAVG